MFDIKLNFASLFTEFQSHTNRTNNLSVSSLFLVLLLKEKERDNFSPFFCLSQVSFRVEWQKKEGSKTKYIKFSVFPVWF